jgi:hypothetical protein
VAGITGDAAALARLQALSHAMPAMERLAAQLRTRGPEPKPANTAPAPAPAPAPVTPPAPPKPAALPGLADLTVDQRCEVQRQLAARVGLVGSIDGVLKRHSMDAMKKWQRALDPPSAGSPPTPEQLAKLIGTGPVKPCPAAR